MRAYVLIQTATASARVASILRSIPGVEVAEDVKGPYDAIAVADTDGSGRPLERVITQIRELPDVTRALVAPSISSLAGVGDGAAA